MISLKYYKKRNFIWATFYFKHTWKNPSIFNHCIYCCCPKPWTFIVWVFYVWSRSNNIALSDWKVLCVVFFSCLILFSFLTRNISKRNFHSLLAILGKMKPASIFLVRRPCEKWMHLEKFRMLPGEEAMMTDSNNIVHSFFFCLLILYFLLISFTLSIFLFHCFFPNLSLWWFWVIFFYSL